MSHAIRPKPPIDEEDSLTVEQKQFKQSFSKQRSIMLKEIGCYFPVKGHRLLLKAVTLPEKTKGGIILTDNHRDSNTKYDIGLVIGMGPEAYMDKQRFPSGPRCMVGDWIDFSPFEKQPKNYNDHLCYVINDDRVNYPIPDITTAVKELRAYCMQEKE